MKTEPAGDQASDGVPLAEYLRRRERVLRALKGAAGAVLAGKGEQPLLGRWRAHGHFFYLTGIENESEAAILFDPSNEDPRRRCALFLRPIDPEAQRYEGYREMIGGALRKRTGFEAVLRTGLFPQLLTQAARRTRRLACLHPFSVYDAPVSPDLAAYKKVTERVPGVTIEDRTELLKEMRAVKSPAELALMGRAIAATAAGYEAAMAAIRPGAGEGEIQEAIEAAYRRQGLRSVAFNTIVGAGVHGTILHYVANDAIVEAGDLIVIDSGASCAGYAADVTRTLPVDGKFTAEQRRLYDTVLEAQEAAIAAARPGACMADLDIAAREVLEKAGCGDAYIHGIGHQLGIETHDVAPDSKLKAGMVITVEPGVYLPDIKTGIRIEDDVLITGRGNRILTDAIPRAAGDIEAAMRRGRGGSR